jgi:hypothetical protein
VRGGEAKSPRSLWKWRKIDWSVAEDDHIAPSFEILKRLEGAG